MKEQDQTKFLARRMKAFEFAFNGLWAGLKRETHLKIHFVATILVTASGIILKITTSDWITVIACCAIILAAELFNSAIERICDLITIEKHPTVKYVKDVSAGAVLMLSIGAAIIGLLIFTKYA